MIKHVYAATFLFGLSVFGTQAGCGGAEPLASPELGLANVLTSQCAQASALKPRFLARQGRSLDGLIGENFTVVGARMACEQVDSLSLSKTDLSGSVAGQPISGSAFLGAALMVRDTSGMMSEIAITKVELDPLDTTAETRLYTLVALDGGGATVRNLCQTDADGRAAAIPLRGRWDDTGRFIADGSITFHCTAGVVAKCIRWGYRPWQSKDGQSLERHHQACTRMARADYCGDGTSQTQEGTKIDMYDSIGIHMATPTLLGLFEASWTPDGPYCIARERWLSVLGLLSPTCQGQYQLSIQASPLRPLDLCFVRRTGSAPQDALINNRSNLLNLSL